MANDLMAYLEGKKCKGFNARPHYHQDGDFVTYFSNDEMAYEERVDEVLTVYRSMESRQLLGCKIKGVQRILEQLAKKAPAASFNKVCPCLSVRAMHIGSCIFAGAMAGAALGGVRGGLAGGALGLFVGVAAAFSKTA